MTLNLEATLRPMVKEITKQVSGRFPRSVLREDMEQDLWLWVFGNAKSLTELIETQPKAWIPQVASTMRKQALSFGTAEKAAAEGEENQDFHKYGLAEVRTLLMDAFDYEDWQSFSSFGDSQPRAKALVNTTGDRIASLVDVKSVLSKLKEEQYNLIVWHFKYGYSFESLGEEFQISSDAARQRVDRAVKAVQKLLGPQPQREYTGRRSVRSNAAWRAASDNQYQEN